MPQFLSGVVVVTVLVLVDVVVVLEVRVDVDVEDDVVVEDDVDVEDDVVVEDVVVVEDDVVVKVDVVVEVYVDVTAKSASGLLSPDFKTSPIGKITAHVMPPKSINKNATKIKIRFFDQDFFTIMAGASAYSISL